MRPGPDVVLTRPRALTASPRWLYDVRMITLRPWSARASRIGSSARSRRLGAVALALGLAASVVVLRPSVAQAGPSNPTPAVVRVHQGVLKGTLSGGVQSFKGIPYAAPPVGALRWQPPQPAGGWHGVRDANSFGSQCAQASGGSEDCLYLNVYAPSHSEGRHLPVMVWIHGGAYVAGSGSTYDPTPLVSRGDVIVVTINYRLGLLGALALPDLDKQSPQTGSGVYSLLDQQAALRWVQQNIHSFGGNAGNVTLFGESAGATYTCLNIASPSAAGLFQAAISESGCGLPATPQARAESFASGVAAQVGCAAGADVDLTCLRGKSLDELNAAAATLVGGNEAAAIGSFSIPVYGGPTLPQSVDGALSSGRYNHVPLMLGSNRNEGRLFVYTGAYGPIPTDDAGYLTLLQTVVTSETGKPAAEVLAEYPRSAYSGYAEALSAAQGDGDFSCLTLHDDSLAAQQGPVYAYEFTDPAAPSPVPGLNLGATHGTELQYLFNMPGRSQFTADQARLSEQMIDYWTTFARTHRPSHPKAPLWPRFVNAAPLIQNLAPSAVGPRPASEFVAAHHCDFWNSTS